jgi:hypothetical protein
MIATICHCPTGKQHVDGCFMSAHPAPSNSDKEDDQLKAVVEARNEWMKCNEYSNLGPVAKKLWDALVAIKGEE